jgi:nucleoid-associated protein EbfC
MANQRRAVPMGAQPNMQQLMKQAQQLQAQMEAAQAELATAEVEGSAGGELVKATVTGTGEIMSVTIDPKAVDPEDVETLGDLVVAAVRAAQDAAQQLQQDKLGPLAGAAGGMPGLGF